MSEDQSTTIRELRGNAIAACEMIKARDDEIETLRATLAAKEKAQRTVEDECAELMGERDDYRQRCDTYRADLVLATTREAALRVGMWAATGLPRNYTDKSHIDEAWRIQRTRQQATLAPKEKAQRNVEDECEGLRKALDAAHAAITEGTEAIVRNTAALKRYAAERDERVTVDEVVDFLVVAAGA